MLNLGFEMNSYLLFACLGNTLSKCLLEILYTCILFLEVKSGIVDKNGTPR